MLGLHDSRWAPRTSRNQFRSPDINSTYNSASVALHRPNQAHRHPSPAKVTPTQKQLLARQAGYARFLRLLRRLKWKSHMLLFSHHRALSQPISTPINGMDLPMERGEAETMFRVDFFEWYVLLERCLVCLLASVGVAVSAGYDPGTRSDKEDGWGAAGRVGALGEVNGGARGEASLIGDSKAFANTGGYGHRFHENVLAALDSGVGNPLHEVLGTGRVREYIGVAKEFRNRWKDVDENTIGMNPAELEIVMDRRLRRYEKILKDLNLDEMLGWILEALERARGVAQGELQSVAGATEGAVPMEQATGEFDMADAPFEAGIDAMEWD